MRPLLTPELLLQGYAQGIFPMAEGRDSAEIYWVDPRERGILPLDGFHLSRSLRKRMRRGDITATLNQSFAQVVTACADRDETWINEAIFDLYLSLHKAGFAHSIEIRAENQLIGGVYGVTIGSAFFGESMFSGQRDGSKMALTFAVDLLRRSDFMLFDTQFLTPHLQSLGAIEISRKAYQHRLAAAIKAPGHLILTPTLPPADQVLQRMTQMS